MALAEHFLSPWWSALHRSLAHGEPNHRVRGCIHCYPFPAGLTEDDDATCLEVCLAVVFPAGVEAREQERHRLSRVREALELFTVLAAVNRLEFVKFFSEFMTDEDVVGLISGKYSRVLPVWRCYLLGLLSPYVPVATQPSVTWGQLFGYPNDPWVYSTDFHQAMEQVKSLGPSEPEIWRELRLEVDWAFGHESLSSNGEQDLSRTEMGEVLTLDEFSRELGKVFELEIPRVLHFCAVQDRARVIRAWSGSKSQAPASNAETYKAQVDHDTIPEMTKALAMTDFACLKVELEDETAKNKPVTEISGFLFSTLIAGRSMCKLTGANRAMPAVMRDAKVKELEMQLTWASNSKVAAVCSAAAESSLMETLRVSVGADINHSEDQTMDLTRWGWLVYGLCAGESTTPDKMLHSGMSVFNLTQEYVSITIEVLKTNYPEPVLEGNSVDPLRPPEYGFLTVPEGTELRLGGLANLGSNTVFVLSRSHRCRAHYNPATMSECIDVVVPGYGICRMKLGAGDRMKQFVQDSANCRPDRSRRLREFSLVISDLESERLVADLLRRIGGGLRELCLNYCGNHKATLKLCDVAAVCPDLEDLEIICFDVSAPLTDELCGWGLEELTIDDCNLLCGLPACLANPKCRMSRELLKVEITASPDCNVPADIIKALAAHDKEFLPLVKETFPLHSKAAMLSAAMSGDDANGQTKAIHRLDPVLLELIFQFAATPKQRSVEVHES